MGYTLNLLFTSRIESVSELRKDDSLTPTGSACAQLCNALIPTRHRRHTVFMDNAFTTVPLLRNPRQRNIGGCGTARANASGWPQNLSVERGGEEWGDVQATVVRPVAASVDTTTKGSHVSQPVT